MKRLAIAAVLATGLGLVATGCGVQPTGVNVAQTAPFSAPGSGSSPSSSQSPAAYQMTLYYIPVTSGYLIPEIHPFATKPGINDLLQALKTTDDEQMVTWVPQDLKLIPTSNAHQYYASTTEKLNSQALDQLACTFSAYWRRFPDPGKQPSAWIIVPGGGGTNGWDDCSGLLGQTPG
ncbi:hypothetical protein KGQ20_38915 [Catenulispora sp. NF23]|uniref:Uncharacterized protein n=1 Tax=Catenulispora pinistramenti TaxID=2705254 RepID=A0ABS5L2U0_9ACTN|nr:hypothetical protein [Catenulispora pinistramenti]MBS2538735.1 hypothetical protein [Catenulispora pinistramenti]MBS2552635.1 hypothetical protein [Catenulispora pinistramenti]